MNTIELQHTLPEVFAENHAVTSDIWHKQVAFQRGQFYLIEASSGTGKSSLCNFIYGVRTDYQGLICFDGENIRTFSVSRWVEIRKKSLSMLFQDLRLFPELTAAENVQMKNSLTGYQTKKQVKQWFEALGIDDKWNQPVGKMSFGQQQRVAFIRALCQPCHFIFLDEPVSHLDEDNARIMGAILAEEAHRQGMGVIVTSIGNHLPMEYTTTFSL